MVSLVQDVEPDWEPRPRARRSAPWGEPTAQVFISGGGLLAAPRTEAVMARVVSVRVQARRPS